ncbi:MAG: histidine phosphatase family protein [Patescibacteria group bacterium]|nr:MAG: histidine phosphatase family protein [Patescibacteria group bacterium]
MKLVVARHGTTFKPDEESRYQGQRLDLPLSALGRAQAKRLVFSLRRHGIKPDRVVSGPHLRQRETAEIIAAAYKLPTPSVEPLFSEIDYGPWEGLSGKDAAARWPEATRGWKKKGVWPGLFGGSFEAHVEALRAWIARLPEEGTTLAVSSQGLMRAMYAAVDPDAWKSACQAGRATVANLKTGAWGEIGGTPARPRLLRWQREPSWIDWLPFFF